MYEDLIDRLRETSMDFGELDHVSAILIEAADAIENLDEICQLKAEDLRNTSKWIPVSKRLPEKEDEAVIVWEKQGFALIDWRHDNKWAILDNNYGIATHWMPLPEPPMEGE